MNTLIYQIKRLILEFKITFDLYWNDKYNDYDCKDCFYQTFIN